MIFPSHFTKASVIFSKLMISCSILLVSTNFSGVEIENKGLKSDFSDDQKLAENEDISPAVVS